MNFDLDNTIHWLTSSRTMWIVLWMGLAVLTIALLVLARTRWGHARPLSKCMVLSVFAHLLLVGYAYKTDLFSTYPAGSQQTMMIQLISHGDQLEARDDPSHSPQPWERFVSEMAIQPPPPSPERNETEALEIERADDEDGLPATIQPTLMPEEAAVNHAVPEFPLDVNRAPRNHVVEASTIHVKQPAPDAETTQAAPETSSPDRVEPVDDSPPVERGPAEFAGADPTDQIDAQIQRLAQLPETSANQDAEAAGAEELVDGDTGNPATEGIHAPPNAVDALAGLTSIDPARFRRSPAEAVPLERLSVPGGGESLPEAGETLPGAGETLPSGSAAPTTVTPGIPPVARRTVQGDPLPELYQLRVAEDRRDIAGRFGGNRDTEAAVEAALQWLVENQSTDGRWDTDALGGGRGHSVAGHARGGAGAAADTGITGLALLALLGAGHTHLEGNHRQTVQHGLEFILRSQAHDGNLAGGARLFARMYCHGMALFAISEAYAMTGDDRLHPFVTKAVSYSVATQHSVGGGWRYQAGDAGDMSQFGWQVMALKSARLAGVTYPSTTDVGMRRFLERHMSGRYRGLASYRVGERSNPTMTAEALACRIFLDAANDSMQVSEAADLLMSDLPRTGAQHNLYYWYYATLSLYQLHDQRWEVWNGALQTALLGTQRHDGRWTGSWNPDTVWGGYGGRAYSTAMSALCLEVYYRYLPVYGGAGSGEPGTEMLQLGRVVPRIGTSD